MIRAQGITKIYKTGTKETIAINDISFTIQKGEFVTITGRSGSGKSTLMYQLGLLDRPTRGSLSIEDQDVISMSEKKRSIYRLSNLGYVFQDYALIPTLTALENILVTLYMQGIKNGEAKKIATKALEQVGLKDRTNNKPSQLSGGEQQRVSIARAIANKPAILFADEPTANLDSETAQTVLNVLIDLNKKGQTILMVTHEPDYAKLGNRQFVLSDGKLISS